MGRTGRAVQTHCRRYSFSMRIMRSGSGGGRKGGGCKASWDNGRGIWAVAARGGAARPVGILEGAFGGSSGAAAVAGGSGTAIGAAVPGRQREVRVGSVPEPAAEGSRAARGDDPVHDAVRRLRRVVVEA